MKNFNKILALVLALMMLISVVVVVPASAAEVTYNTTALERLVKLGIYKGYGANELGEKDDVTREQMAMFVARVMTGKVSNDAWANFVNDTPFKDINDRPAVNIAAIAYAYDEGVIIGRSADVYGPKDNVTYQEALTMVVRALLGYKATKDFKYPEGFINAANLMGLTDGISGVNYNEKAIRGVTATILYNALTVEYEELVWTGMWPWPTLVPNTFANKFNLTTDKYMLTSTTEVRTDVLGNKYESTHEFNGDTNTCVDGDYVVFTELEDDVTFATDAQGVLVDRTILATELADDLGADLTKKIGYVYDLTFEGEKLAWVDEYVGTTYRDYGMVEDKIATTTVNDEGVNKTVLVVDGQKYDQTAIYVDLESKNPTKVYDLILMEYNKDIDPIAGDVRNGVVFNGKIDVADVTENMFQEVTLFDTNRDGMYDYGIYMPYYIGNYVTGDVKVTKDVDGVLGNATILPRSNQVYDAKGNEVKATHFAFPGTTTYNFQYGGYFTASKATNFDIVADWEFSQKMVTYSNFYVYKVNPASKNIDIVEAISRSANVGKVTKVVNNALVPGDIISATVGGKDYTNINILTEANLYGITGFLTFEEMERMPSGLKGIADWDKVFEAALINPGKYGNLTVYELAGITIYAWPSIVRNYDFVTFDWMDANFSIENNNVLVVDHALTDASGNYQTVKIVSIQDANGYNGYHTFDGMEYEAFCDTIEVLYANPDLNQFNMYFNDVQRAAIMANPVYAQQLRLNIMEEINGATGAIAPELFVIKGQDANGNLILNDAHGYEALISPAVALTDESNAKKTVAGTIEFANGIACGAKDGQFVSSSRDTKVVSTAKKMVMTDSTVFTIVAADGIFTYTGKPADNYKLVLTADTLVIAANTANVMIEDRTRSINAIAIGDVEYFGKFMDQNCNWINRAISNTWAFNENTNNCPQGFKWLVDNAYLVTSETKLQTVTNENGVLYVYTNLYNLVTCKYEEVAFVDILLNLNDVLVADRVLGYVKTTYASIFNVDNTDFLNGANWSTDKYVGKVVSGSTVGYYEFQTGGRFAAPNFIIISTIDVVDADTGALIEKRVVVTTAASDLRAGADVHYTLVNGVPTGYATQAYTIKVTQ